MLFLIKRLVSATSVNKDKARREFILNVLLLGLIILTFIAFVHACITHIINLNSAASVPPFTIFCFSFFFSFLLFLSKRGKVAIAAFIFIASLYLAAFYTVLIWGTDVSHALLVFALTIVMAGILINTPFAFFVTAIIGITLLSVSFLQAQHLYIPDTRWRALPHNFGDTVLRVGTLIVITVVSWLSNREIGKALKRARASEAALKKYNEELEFIIEKRTRELQEMQVDKFMQLYKFSEFGRMASGLLHDLVNHLNLISLNLDRLNETNKHLKQEETQKLLDRTLTGTKRLEEFVLTARKQMQNQEVLQLFSVKNEVKQAIQLLAYKAKKVHVHITFKAVKDIKIFGNPIKFSQVMTNLIVNAIDAYDGNVNDHKVVELNLRLHKANVWITVQDWGSGINSKYLPKIFDSLFTTKSFEKGMGLGLSVCKEVIEKDFRGKIKVESSEGKGTKFILVFPMRKAPRGKLKVNAKV